jgi:pilin isopeptide linkage protein
MKKFKKLLSMILAAAMVCSVNTMPAFADEDGETSEATTEAASETEAANVSGQIRNDNGITKLPFTKVLKTNDAMIITDTTFEFTMVPDSPTTTTKSGLSYQAGPNLGTKGTVTLSINSALKDDITTLVNTTTTDQDKMYVEGLAESSVKGIALNGEFDLSDLTFTEAGIYRYKVQETQDSKSSATITYDETIFIVDLWVKMNDDNTSSIYVIQSQLYASDEKKPLVFENSLKTSTLKIQKNVNGTKAVPKDTEYTFWIKIPTGGTSINLTQGLAISAKKYTTSNETPTDVNSIKVGGTMEQEQDTATAKDTTNTDDSGWCKFELKNGEYLEITGLPAGMVYYLFEQDYQSEGFVTYNKTMTGDDITPPDADSFTSDDKGNYVNNTTAKGKNAVFFLNTADIPSNTGIVLDVMPYVAIVLAAAACAVLFIAINIIITT